MSIVKTGWDLNPELRELADLGEGEMVADILRGFLNDAEDQIREAEEAMRTRDGDRLKFAAHSLTGSAATVGLNDFSAVARQLHVLARARKFPESHEQLKTLRNQLPEAKEALMQFIREFQLDPTR
jgi:HPt (histidine-containing phosphotransfer) domain-containing protein